MRFASFALLVLALLLGATGLHLRAAAQEPGDAEEVSVIDADTLQVGNRIVHLAGIDAPELGQRCKVEDKEWRCGLEAALALRKLIAFGNVACTTSEDGAIVTGACTAAGKDLGEVLLSQGYALALNVAFPTYKSAEMAAQEAKLGLWRGDFVRPDEWRSGTRLPGETTDTTFCVVKAAVTEEQQKIFFVPSDEDYAAVTIDPERGERIFCSDDEAILAGWTRFPRAKPSP